MHNKWFLSNMPLNKYFADGFIFHQFYTPFSFSTAPSLNDIENEFGLYIAGGEI